MGVATLQNQDEILAANRAVGRIAFAVGAGTGKTRRTRVD